ncbi:HD domain-containing protein [Clostridium sp. SHJSY1]|uniref:HD domain-containing protein n=1 Tax=Clostridium sp. SHJSY1 TaxID=2942483 RepID=UPI00287712FA|nr:HD domain-containing protein [Clostridium sp. SHJSY1]MDS0524360.1 HD domain-containing protein [Clostridium sp. SHJSY1]
MKIKKVSEYVWGEKVSMYLMINKILDLKNPLIWVYAGDNTKEIKCVINCEKVKIKEGDVILAKGQYSEPFKPDSFEFVEKYEIKDFLPVVKRPIEDIMNEIENISCEEFKSKEAKTLNDYFFKNEHFIEKFRDAIGGVYNHHNYLGGLAEHTLNVMYLTKTLAYRYDCRYKEIAILGAKIHDIGKVYEMEYNGPFKYTLKGSLEGHIVMGVNMVERAFKEYQEIFSETFMERIKAIIVQHHGKLEFGSPIPPRTEEAYVVHYADYVDATMNKIQIISEGISENEWSNYDKRIESRLFL